MYPRWQIDDMFESKYIKNQARYEKAVTSFVGSSKLFQTSKEYFLLPMPFEDNELFHDAKKRNVRQF